MDDLHSRWWSGSAYRRFAPWYASVGRFLIRRCHEGWCTPWKEQHTASESHIFLKHHFLGVEMVSVGVRECTVFIYIYIPYIYIHLFLISISTPFQNPLTDHLSFDGQPKSSPKHLPKITDFSPGEKKLRKTTHSWNGWMVGIVGRWFFSWNLSWWPMFFWWLLLFLLLVSGSVSPVQVFWGHVSFRGYMTVWPLLSNVGLRWDAKKIMKW